MPFLFRRTHRPSIAPRSRAVSRLSVERHFGEQYRRLYGKAARFARRFVDDAAEDVVQDAFLQLWTSCYTEGEVELERADALLLKILRDTIVDYLRAQEREMQRDDDQENILDISARIENQTNTARVAEGNALSARISYIVETLPLARRRVYQIASANMWDARLAARELGIAYNTARWHLTRAVESVRVQLEKDGYRVPASLGVGRRGRRET
jgi:RNA polymerase sigma factor (sigma-70 family)